jgi:hypothetical protein
VLDYLEPGQFINKTCGQHSYLTLAETDAAMTHDFDQQAEIDREVHDEVEPVEQEWGQDGRFARVQPVTVY